ncbi:MAG: dihydroorotate dehydrogenase [Thermoanaerobaculaceae bacterium]|nr:dihydroorotate dehydrogenase [Thermoanaerobaculaceae bacterium]
MEIDLKVDVGKIELKNPLLLASGCAGYGLEFDDFFDVSKVGGVCLKGLSINESKGNNPPRIWETPSGMMNAIGLQNIGIKNFLKEKAPHLRKIDTVFVANFYGHKVEEYVEAAKMLDDEECIKALEMNISCPNISAGGIQFGVDPLLVHKVVSEVRKETKKPLCVKLTPSGNIKETAKSAFEAGADALVAINTIPAMAIDTEKMDFRIFNKVGGLSGPAIHPIAVKMVFDVVSEVPIPIIGCGGVEKGSDGIEFLLLGARAFQVGTALFYNPKAPLDIINELKEYLKRKGFNSIKEIIGKIKTKEKEKCL